MSHKYADIFFTDNVKAVQIENHSRGSYARFEQGEDVNFLMSQREADFISERDSFYMASVTETGWPYLQHRGGPEGFIKIIDEKTLGIADFSGNSQYVSTGNFRNNNRVSLFFMDYANRVRLKVAARVSVIAEDDLETLVKLEDPDYRAQVERGFLFHIEAFDWNCPQHITPRYTDTYIKDLISPLEKENKNLRERLSSGYINKNETVLGTGSLSLVITGVRQLATNVRAYEFRATDGGMLPEVTAGSHLSIPVRLKNGEVVQRHYSICSNPSRRDIYEIAVLKDEQGKGGSEAVHSTYHLGMKINCELPSNHFELHSDRRPSILIAGGIGITPIKAMAQKLKAEGKNFELHYAGKNQASMAFYDRLQREFNEQVTIYESEKSNRMQTREIMNSATDDSVFYACGPKRLIDYLIEEAEVLGIDKSRVKFERFSASQISNAKDITVTLKKSDVILKVPADKSILDTALDAGVVMPYSCKTGDCRTCAVKVVEGTAEHFDNALTQDERDDLKMMCPCVSRAESEHLVLDV